MGTKCWTGRHNWSISNCITGRDLQFGQCTGYGFIVYVHITGTIEICALKIISEKIEIRGCFFPLALGMAGEFTKTAWSSRTMDQGRRASRKQFHIAIRRFHQRSVSKCNSNWLLTSDSAWVDWPKKKCDFNRLKLPQIGSQNFAKLELNRSLLMGRLIVRVKELKFF